MSNKLECLLMKSKYISSKIERFVEDFARVVYPNVALPWLA